MSWVQPSKKKKDGPSALGNPQIGICILSARSEIIFKNSEYDAINALHDLFSGTEKTRLIVRNSGLKTFIGEALSGEALAGRHGARPRRESLSLHVPESNGTLFIEISPASKHPELGKFPEGSQVIMMLDIDRLQQDYSAGLAKFFPLSDAELEISQLIIGGYSNNEIAEIRGRSRETVNSQVKSVLRKTYTSGRTELCHLSYALSRSFTAF